MLPQESTIDDPVAGNAALLYGVGSCSGMGGGFDRDNVKAPLHNFKYEGCPSGDRNYRLDDDEFSRAEKVI